MTDEQWTNAQLATLDELHDLLDCVQADGTISGLDECSHDSTLGTTLHHVLSSYNLLLSACRTMIEVTGGSEVWNGETTRALREIEAAIATATTERP